MTDDTNRECSGAVKQEDVRGERLHPISDINDLHEVCRELSIQDSHVTPADAVRELRSRIEQDAKRIEELEKALRPFAEFIGRGGFALPDNFVITKGSELAHTQLTVRDCRIAAAALSPHLGQEKMK